GKFTAIAPQLITDFCGYNAYTPKPKREDDTEEDRKYYDPGYFWVGDLTISCRANIASVREGSRLILELNEGERRYRCEIDISTGLAVLKMNITENRKEEEKKEERKLSKYSPNSG
ncbi:MAG: hypothetical protein IH802_06000, partial [Nitrospinae bacterium]|nr:hypothetical protein [Nitrospinota bacterium]